MEEKKDNRGNIDNLVSLADRPAEERSEIARKGGLASVESKRQKRTMKQIIEEIFEKEINEISIDPEVKAKLIKKYGEHTTVDIALIKAQIEKASLTGDTRAIEFLRDTKGEKQAEKVEYKNVSEEVINKMELLVANKKVNNELTTEKGVENDPTTSDRPTV